MEPVTFASFILVEEVSKTALGEIYKALPLEGDAELRFLYRVSEEVSREPTAATLFLTHAQRWKTLRDLYALNLMEFGQEGDRLFFTFEFVQGRLLQDVLSRCGTEGIPLAADQAVYLANRTAGALVSLSTQDLHAGCLSPQTVFITFEGEVKLLPTVFRDLQTTPLAPSGALSAYRNYLPPAQREGAPSKAAADRWSLGALFFEFLCREPFFQGEADFDPAARMVEAKEGIGFADGLPENLLSILDRALVPDAEGAYRDLDTFKTDLDQLITSGEYSPTTFNIAFLMHSLFRNEDEEEAGRNESYLTLDRESFRPQPEPEPEPEPEPAQKTQPSFTPPGETTAVIEDPSFGVEEEPGRRGLLVGLGIAAVLAVAGFLVWFVFLRETGPTAEEIKAQYEERLAAEQAKLEEKQREIAAQLEQAQQEKEELESQLAEAQTAEDRARAQQALDEARRRQEQALARQEALAREKPPPPSEAASEASGEAAGDAASEAPAEASPAGPGAEPASDSGTGAAEAPSQPVPSGMAPPKEVQAGDFVEFWALDVKPKAEKKVKVSLTRMARRHKVRGKVFVEAFIDQTGTVTRADIVKGMEPPDYGMNEACREAVLATKYSVPIKNGVPVRTKVTLPFSFR